MFINGMRWRNPKGLTYQELLKEQSKEYAKQHKQEDMEELIITMYRKDPEGFRDWVDNNFPKNEAE